MKKILIVVTAGILVVGCDNNNSNPKESAAGNQMEESPKDPVVLKGLELVANSDCLGCHNIAKRMTGPSYTAIAERYSAKQGAVDDLAGKIINGGAGNWGPIPMTPHANIPKEDAKAMVTYILSLKNAQ